MAKLERPQINISSIKVAGVGGLGMIVVLGVMAYALPAVRAFALVSLVGGVLAGLTIIAYHRRQRPEPPNRPTLMVERPVAAKTEDPDPTTGSKIKLSPVASA